MPKPTLMPLDKVVLTPEFRRLKPRHAEWVRRYIQSYITTGIFDHTAATSAVYPSPLPQRIRSKSHMLVHHPKVKAVVELFLTSGMRELDHDLVEIQQAIDAAAPGGIAQQRLIILKARLKYGTKSVLRDPSRPEPADSLVQVEVQAERRRPAIGDIVQYEGRNFRVTALDPDGNPSAGDPIDADGNVIPE